jgi:hypothetical protein
MADAHGSGPCVRKDVRVQLPPRPRATHARGARSPSRGHRCCSGGPSPPDPQPGASPPDPHPSVRLVVPLPFVGTSVVGMSVGATSVGPSSSWPFVVSCLPLGYCRYTPGPGPRHMCAIGPRTTARLSARAPLLRRRTLSRFALPVDGWREPTRGCVAGQRVRDGRGEACPGHSVELDQQFGAFSCQIWPFSRRTADHGTESHRRPCSPGRRGSRGATGGLHAGPAQGRWRTPFPPAHRESVRAHRRRPERADPGACTDTRCVAGSTADGGAVRVVGEDQ